jgi:hypothetical protein
MMVLEFSCKGMTLLAFLRQVSSEMSRFTDLIFLLFRNIAKEFAARVLDLREDSLRNTPAYREAATAAGQQLFQARVLAYSTATWLAHANALKVFTQFCHSREIDIFQCTPYSLNLYLLHIAQTGKSFGSIQRFLSALSFVLKFFGSVDIVRDPAVYELKRFLAKVCPHVVNKKQPFGSAEVRALWDRIDAAGGLQALTQTELRTFVLTVTQHASFCRYSDLQNVKLDDLVFELDYVKIHIRYSKTDQEGIGQTVFIPKNHGRKHDAHMLLCLYLSTLPADVNEPETVFLFPPLS